MPGDSTTSNAEMRSVAMNKKDSPRSYTSRTFPRRASGNGRDVSRIAAVMARDCKSASAHLRLELHHPDAPGVLAHRPCVVDRDLPPDRRGVHGRGRLLVEQRL